MRKTLSRQLLPFAALLIATLAAAAMIPAALAPAAQAAEPLLQPGRETLHQRILTRPAAEIRAEPAAGAAATEAPPAFSVLYVFERRQVAGDEWLQVGPVFEGPALGWLPAVDAIDWHQQLVLAFNNPATRLRNLFFGERTELVDFLEDENLLANAQQAVAEADAGGTPAGGDIISIEPAAFADIDENFYLLPILETEPYLMGGAFDGLLVKVASIPIESEAEPEKTLEDFNAAIVFVVDTTRSMDPYIQRTKKAIRDFTREFEGTPIAERISFGIVAFRDNTEGTSNVDYVSRVILEPSWPPNPAAIEPALELLSVAGGSTKGFTEDGLAGMETAISLPAWEQFDGARFIVYVSDAGVRDSKDLLAATGKNPGEINELAKAKGIATMAMHLLTPAGAPYRELAEAQYRLLAAWEGGAPLYFPIPEGDVDAFGEAVDAASAAVVDIVEASLGGDLIEYAGGSDPAAAGNVQESTLLVGRAMQLAYLGRVGGTTAPDLFEAWAFDHAMDNPNRQSFEIRVLLNRNQINDLSQRLNAVLDAATQSQQTGSRDFIQTLRGTMARFISDPARLQAAEEVGDFLGEFLDAIPYRSQVLTIDEAYWGSMGSAAQAEILSGIQSKLAAYQYIYEDIESWTPLYEGAPANELVYPIPLSLLP